MSESTSWRERARKAAVQACGYQPMLWEMDMINAAYLAGIEDAAQIAWMEKIKGGLWSRDAQDQIADAIRASVKEPKP